MKMLIDGREVSVKCSYSDEVTLLVVSFKGKFFAHAVFRRYKQKDGVAVESHGIIREFELNGKDFNGKVYIECEDEFFIRQVLGSSQARGHLAKILQDFNYLKINGNECVMGKYMGEDIESGADPDADDDSDTGKEVGPSDDPNFYVDLVKEKGALMLAFVDSFPAPEVGKKSSTPLTDRNIWQARMLSTFAMVIFCTGLGLMVWGMVPATLPPDQGIYFPSFQKALPFMVPAVVITAFFFVMCVRRRPRNSLFFLLFVSLLGVVLGCWGGALLLNAG